MSEEATPQPEPTPEMEVAYRSLSMTLIQAGEVIGAGAAGGAANALVSNLLQGDKAAESEPDTAHVELPPGVPVETTRALRAFYRP
jgi:hypothetical protein